MALDLTEVMKKAKQRDAARGTTDARSDIKPLVSAPAATPPFSGTPLVERAAEITRATKQNALAKSTAQTDLAKKLGVLNADGSIPASPNLIPEIQREAAGGKVVQPVSTPSTLDRVANTTVGSVKNWVGSGLKSIVEMGDNPLNPITYGLGQYNKLVAPKLVEGTKTLANKLMDSGAQDIAEAKQGASKGGQLAVDLGSGALQLAGDIALGAATGGGTAIPAAMRGFGSGIKEATDNGGNRVAQIAYGTLNGLTTYFTNEISNAGLFKTAYGRGALDDVFNNAAAKAISKFTSSAAGQEAAKRIASGLYGAAGEGLENVIQDAITPLLQKLTYSKAKFSELYSDKQIENMLYDGLVGAILGGAAGSVNVDSKLSDAVDSANVNKPTAQIPSENVQLTAQNTPNNVSVDNQTNAKANVVPNVNALVPNIVKPTQNTAQDTPQLPTINESAKEVKLPTNEENVTEAKQSTPEVKISEESQSGVVDGIKDANLKAKVERDINSKAWEKAFSEMGYKTLNDKSIAESEYQKDGDGLLKAVRAKSDFEILERKYQYEYSNDDNFVKSIIDQYGAKENQKNRNKVVEDSFSKPDWQVPQSIMIERVDAPWKNNAIIKEHRQSVIDALNSGENVPSEVLKDYPDLATKSPIFPENSLGAKITKGMPEGTGAATQGFDKLGAMVDKYGAIPEGENPHSTERVTEERIPKQTAEDNLVSQTVRTAYEAPVTTNETADVIEQATLSDLFSYKKATDKAAIEKAESTIRDKGWDTALKDWTADVRSGKVSKDITATGWTLYNNAANSGNAKQAVEILVDLTNAVRSGAQSTQAVRLLKKMSPEYQLYAVQRSVQNFQDELNAKYGDKAPGLKIEDAIAQEYLDALTAKDDVAAKAAMEKIYREVASHIPSTFADKWNAWRYTAMLTNPVTHIKNVIGNYAFKGERAIKNVLSATAQTTAKKLGANFEQTRSIALTKKDAPLIKACYDDYVKVADDIYKVGKYDDVKNRIEDYRTIFKNKALEGVRKFNTEALNTEDMWVSRPAYVNALAGYLKANNATLQSTDTALLDRARAFAILEAQKAAYRDSNAFSDWVSSVGRGRAKSVVAKGMKIMTEGVVPFRRTPANILMRGLEYSPVGLTKAITYDTYRVAKGQIAPSEFIDNVSEGLTGTALFGLGAFLAAQGLVSVGGSGDDKEDKLAEIEGYQKFALNIGGKSYTIDWLAPAAMPLFMGAALYNLQTDKKGDGVKLDDVLKVASDVSGPLLETSMLSSLNDFIDGFTTAKQQDQNLIYYGIMQSALSYLGQAVPTIGGRIARTIDPTRRTSFTDPTSGVPADLQYFAQSQLSKIPFAASTKQPYVDQWGRTQETESLGSRLLQNFVSPSYVKDIKVSDMEKELDRLYNAYGKENEVNVLPPISVKKYFSNNGESVYMTADEYTQFKKTSGQTAYSELTKLTSSAEYKAMTDADKAKAVSEVYSEAAEKAKTEIMESRGDMRIPTAADGEKIQSYVDTAGITEKQAYDLYKAIDEAGAKTNTNAGKYTVIQTIAKQGLTPKQQAAVVATLYTSHDKETGAVTDESLLPYISNSARLLSLYTQSKGENTDLINMTIPKSFEKNGETIELTDAEKKLYKDTYIKYFNAHITSVSTDKNVVYYSKNAADRAKQAVINGRKT